MNLVDSFYVGSTSVEVALSDIVEADAEVVVNSICDALHFGDGVSGAFVRAGGLGIERAVAEAAKGREVRPGDVLVTDAGAMGFRYIFHAISSRCETGTTEEILRRCTLGCLAEARKRGVKSIAFPALGTGDMAFDMNEAAAVLIDAVVRDCASAPGLERVVFCLLRPNAFTTFFRQAVRRGVAMEAGAAGPPAGEEDVDLAFDETRGLLRGRPEPRTDVQPLVERIRSADDRSSWDGLVAEALKALFVPPLAPPVSSGDGGGTPGAVEMVFPNRAPDGFWRSLDQRFGASSIPVMPAGGDAGALDAAVERMRRRLRESDGSRVGLVVGRAEGTRGLHRVALEAHRDEQVVLLVLDPLDLSQMLELREAGKPVEPYLEAKISALSVTSAEREAFAQEVEAPSPRKVFVSYAHEDAAHKEWFWKSVRVLRIQGRIEPWSDGKILPGARWKDEIFGALDRAEIVVCLVSMDFIASEFCFSTELTRALERRRAGGTTVVPIIVRPCEWDQTPLAELQAVPTDESGNLVEVTQWDDPDVAWLRVARQFRRLVADS